MEHEQEILAVIKTLPEQFDEVIRIAKGLLNRVVEQDQVIHGLLKNVGDLATCRGCGAPIYWVRHLNNRIAPYDPTGVNHFSTCPQAKQFKKGNVNAPSST